MDDSFSFDLSAASWRHGITDEQAYAKALATRLEQALPGKARVEWEHRMFSSERTLRLVEVAFDHLVFRLVFDHKHGVRAEKCKVVRDIALKTEEVDFSTWLQELSTELSALAQQHEESRNAMEQFLFS